jgi:hypothetical protein
MTNQGQKHQMNEMSKQPEKSLTMANVRSPY